MPEAAKVKAKPKGVDLFERVLVTNSAPASTWLTVYGPRKNGKTTTAFTLSKAFTDLGMTLEERIAEVRSGEFEPIEIDDMAFIQIDTGGTQAAIDIGARLKYIIDYNAVMAQGYSANDALPAAIKAAIEALPDTVQWLVPDTISSFDTTALPENLERAGDDQRVGYSFHLQAHRDVVLALRKWPRDVLILCHARALVEVDMSKQSGQDQQKQRKATYGQAPDVIPEITGKGAGLYLNNSSLIAAQAKRLDTKSRSFQYRLFSGNDIGYDGGSRFESLLLELTNGDLTKGFEPNLGELMRLYRQRFE